MSFVKKITLVLLISCVSCFPQGVVNTNPDGSLNLAGKLPLNGQNGDKNLLSAIGSLNEIKDGGFRSAFALMALENIAGKGHSLSLSKSYIPSFGNQLTAAESLLNEGPHRVDAGAFVTRNIPKNPNFDSFTTGGGSLGYNYGSINLLTHP